LNPFREEALHAIISHSDKAEMAGTDLRPPVAVTHAMPTKFRHTVKPPGVNFHESQRQGKKSTANPESHPTF
jgi:hypothetical protein